jgi:hypothetical protein
MEPWEEEINRIRSGVEEFIRIPNFAESGWDPASDAEFWDTLDAMERVGEERDASQANWLASFTRIDDFGPMGRALFLSRAALVVLSLMPDLALNEAKRLIESLQSDVSITRKVGVIKILESSGLSEAVPFIQGFLSDANPIVVREAEWSLKRLLNHS